MWWVVVQTDSKEIHVYPLCEEREHILDDGLCNCMPEVKRTASRQMVVHKKLGEEHRILHVHWVQG